MNTPKLKSDLFILAGLSCLLFFYHILTGIFSDYGYFIDELYFIACSKRLAFGYVDQPPLSIALLALSRWGFGGSVFAVRFFSALAMGATVFLTGLTASRLGGSRTAILLSALAAMVMPVYLLFGSFYSMNAFEPLVWTAIVFQLIRMVQEDRPQHWVSIGILTGIGLEMKHTLILYVISMILAIFLTNHRRYFFNRWFLYGALACFALLVPNLVWQVQHGFPSIELYRNSMGGKNIARMPWNVLADQALLANICSFPLWIAGLVFFFLARGGKYRFLGWCYLLLLCMMILGESSRPDRIGAAYTSLFAGGAVAFGQIRQPSIRRYFSWAMVFLLITGGVVFTPVFTPLLPPKTLRKYLSTLGLTINLEKGKMNEPVPQWLADRLGWRELAETVAGVYRSLLPGEQRNAVIISTNYGEAGALELYGPEFGLPSVYATHNSFHTWGPPPDSVRTYICVYVDREDIREKFDTVVEAAVATCEDCTLPQRRIPVYIARGPRFSMSAEWAGFKMYQ